MMMNDGSRLVGTAMQCVLVLLIQSPEDSLKGQLNESAPTGGATPITNALMAKWLHRQFVCKRTLPLAKMSAWFRAHSAAPCLILPAVNAPRRFTGTDGGFPA
jgi:hypothetical protein